MSSEKKEDKLHVTWTGWVSLVILLVMVSGGFRNSAGPLAALDFTNSMWIMCLILVVTSVE